MRRTLTLLAFAVSGGTLAHATSCGTVAAPTSCTITVGGTNTFTFSAFTFGLNSASGGGQLYTGGDIDIDLATGGGLTALLTFTKHPGSPASGIVFFANPGESDAFSFQYNVTLNVLGPGTVAFTDPVSVDLNTTHTNNALASLQTILPGAPNQPCLAFTGSTHANCLLPPGGSLTQLTGQILSLSGNAGNTGVTQFTNLFNSTFTPAAATPEPSSLVLLGAGLLGLGVLRRRTA